MLCLRWRYLQSQRFRTSPEPRRVSAVSANAIRRTLQRGTLGSMSVIGMFRQGMTAQGAWAYRSVVGDDLPRDRMKVAWRGSRGQ